MLFGAAKKVIELVQLLVRNSLLAQTDQEIMFPKIPAIEFSRETKAEELILRKVRYLDR